MNSCSQVSRFVVMRVSDLQIVGAIDTLDGARALVEIIRQSENEYYLDVAIYEARSVFVPDNPDGDSSNMMIKEVPYAST